MTKNEIDRHTEIIPEPFNRAAPLSETIFVQWNALGTLRMKVSIVDFWSFHSIPPSFPHNYTGNGEYISLTFMEDNHKLLLTGMAIEKSNVAQEINADRNHLRALRYRLNGILGNDDDLRTTLAQATLIHTREYFESKMTSLPSSHYLLHADYRFLNLHVSEVTHPFTNYGWFFWRTMHEALRAESQNELSHEKLNGSLIETAVEVLFEPDKYPHDFIRYMRSLSISLAQNSLYADYKNPQVEKLYKMLLHDLIKQRSRNATGKNANIQFINLHYTAPHKQGGLFWKLFDIDNYDTLEEVRSAHFQNKIPIYTTEQLLKARAQMTGEWYEFLVRRQISGQDHVGYILGFYSPKNGTRIKGHVFTIRKSDISDIQTLAYSYIIYKYQEILLKRGETPIIID